MMRWSKVGMAALLGFSVSLAQAQEIPKRQRAVGDWCEYAVDGIGISTQRLEVVDVTPGGGYTVKLSADRESEQIFVFDDAGEITGRNGREQKTLSATRPLYPINAQLRGRIAKFSFLHIRRPGVTVEVTSEVASVESEKVTVPAGSFDTLRVHTVSRYQYSDNSYSNQWEETHWYALDPSIKFAVKRTYIDHGRRDSRRIREITKCGTSKPK
ncbi:MAG: hypothetical protein IT530_19150 [Burkholderiales bacterium]|nr:hypothetical protein [Burkholderiales bacterium]